LNPDLSTKRALDNPLKRRLSFRSRLKSSRIARAFSFSFFISTVYFLIILILLTNARSAFLIFYCFFHTLHQKNFPQLIHIFSTFFKHFLWITLPLGPA